MKSITIPSEQEQEIYLTKFDARIEQLSQRSNALVAKIAKTTPVDLTVHSQVELFAAMRFAMKALTIAGAEGFRA